MAEGDGYTISDTGRFVTDVALAWRTRQPKVDIWTMHRTPLSGPVMRQPAKAHAYAVTKFDMAPN